MKKILLSAARPSDPAVSLVCFPHAGGNASTFLAWSRHLPTDVEVSSYQAAGRGARAGESPALSLPDMVEEAVAELEPLLARRPVVLFGHSFGGLMAYEVVRALHARRWTLPQRVIVSGCFPPSQLSLHRGRWEIGSSDAELFDALAAQGGVPRELLPYREVFLPMMGSVRAEFRMLHDYVFQAGAPLPVPLSLFWSQEDALVARADMAPWRALFAGDCDEVVLPGNHYYVDQEVVANTQAVVERLRATALEQMAF